MTKPIKPLESAVADYLKSVTEHTGPIAKLLPIITEHGEEAVMAEIVRQKEAAHGTHGGPAK